MYLFKNILKLSLTASLLLNGYLNAQTSATKIQSTSVPFLLITPDTRSGGLANLHIGISPETNDVFGNNAKLPLLSEKQNLTLNYTPWLSDIGLSDVYLITAGYYKKINEKSCFSSSLKYFSVGDMVISDQNGNILPSSKPYEYSLDLGYSLLLSDHLSIGAKLRYVYSKLINGSSINSGINYFAGKTMAGDISIFYKQKKNLEGFHAGLVLSNLGGRISYSDQPNNKYLMPANLGIGIGYLKRLDEDNSVEFGIDANKLLVPDFPTSNQNGEQDDYFSQSIVSSWFNSFKSSQGNSTMESFRISGGIEYNYNDRFYLRSGYQYGNEARGNGQYATFGASYKVQKIKFNFSYLVPSGTGISKNPLSNTMRFGTSFSF
jgi:hypothetical protein